MQVTSAWVTEWDLLECDREANKMSYSNTFSNEVASVLIIKINFTKKKVSAGIFVDHIWTGLRDERDDNFWRWSEERDDLLDYELKWSVLSKEPDIGRGHTCGHINYDKVEGFSWGNYEQNLISVPVLFSHHNPAFKLTRWLHLRRRAQFSLWSAR